MVLNDDVAALFAAAAQRLAEARVPDEALADFVDAHRVLFFRRRAAMVPVARVWRLGVFLVDRGGSPYTTGTTTRALEPGWSNYQSISSERRRAYQAAAARGSFQKGEVVNFDARRIILDSGVSFPSDTPLVHDNGSVRVLWAPTAPRESAVELGGYLDERVQLLIDPPTGA